MADVTPLINHILRGGSRPSLSSKHILQKIMITSEPTKREGSGENNMSDSRVLDRMGGGCFVGFQVSMRIKALKPCLVVGLQGMHHEKPRLM